MIRQEMQQTRTALTEKLEALEQRMLDTVQTTTQAIQGTASTVQETVNTVKGAIEDTVSSVRQTIQGTVCDVKQSFDGTVDSMKESLDPELQTQRHPWALVGGAVCAGYVSGLVVQRLTQPNGPIQYLPSQNTPATLASEPWSEPRDTPTMAESAFTAPQAPEREPSWADSLTQSLRTNFEPELEKLKGLAIGALFNVAKGFLKSYVPRNIEPQVVEMVDSVTRKMGGRPLQGSIMEEYQNTFR